MDPRGAYSFNDFGGGSPYFAADAYHYEAGVNSVDRTVCELLHACPARHCNL
jgi:hypothetical protein